VSAPNAAPNLCGRPQSTANDGRRQADGKASRRYGQAKTAHNSKRPWLTVDKP